MTRKKAAVKAPKKRAKRPGKAPTEIIPAIPLSDPVVNWDPEDHGAKSSNSSDPIGQVSIFEEHGRGIPSFEDSTPAHVFDYVDRKAQEIGLHIPRNRGVPGTVDDHANMLSQEEKAMIILGRAIGIPYRHVVERLNFLRTEATLPVITSDPVVVCHKAITRHREIVAAIQGDMLAAVEEWSPLVSGQQRFVWRARMIQMYADIIKRLSMEPYNAIRSIDRRGNVEWLSAVDEIRRLDKAMSSHMSFFDKLGAKDMSSFFTNPSEKMKEQQTNKAASQIEEDFAAGTITEVERLQRLRALRHG